MISAIPQKAAISRRFSLIPWNKIVFSCFPFFASCLLVILSCTRCFAADDITLWHQWVGEKRRVLESVVADFNCMQGDKRIVEGIFGPAGGAVTEQLLVEKTGAAKPHLALVEREALPLLADRGLILPIDDLLERSAILRKDNWRPSACASVSYRNHIYGIPINLNPYVLIFNPQLLAKVGGNPPAKWSDFAKMQDLLSSNSAGADKLWVLNSRSIVSLFSIRCIQNGITTLQKDELSRKKEVLAGILHYMKELRERGILPPYCKFWDPNFLEVTGGKVLFQIEDAEVVAEMKDSPGPLAVAPMPSASDVTKTALSHNQVFVLCRADEEEGTRKFLDFFFSSAQYTALEERFFFVCPLMKAPRELDNHDPLYAKVVEAAENAGEFELPCSECGNTSSRIARTVAQLDAGLLSPEQALRAILRTSGESTQEIKKADAITISWAESTRRIFSDKNESLRTLPVKVACARNEHETFQLLLSSERSVRQISLKSNPFQDATGTGRNFPLIVYEESDTSIDVPLVADKPGLYPNVLEPIAFFDLNPEKPVRFWVDIFIPKDAPAGQYHSMMTLSCKENPEARIPVELEVFPLELPSTPSQPAVAGLNYDLIARHYKLKPKSEEERKIMDSFYWFLVEHRLTPYQPPVPLDSTEMSGYLQDERVSGCRIPFSPASPQFDSVLQRAIKEGWLEKLFVYFIDEPTYHQYSAVMEAGKEIHSRNEPPKFLVTCFPEDALLGAVDIFCIHLSFLPIGIPHAPSDRKEFFERVEKRLAAGDEIWWYTAGAVRPFPTLHIEDDPAAFRIIPWMQQLFGIKGFLHWEAANWIQPTNEPLIPFFGNGEGVLVYPGEMRPNPSIRLELLREGLEDMEYLFLLRRNLEKVQRMLSAETLGDVAAERIREICRRLILPEGLENGGEAFALMFCNREPGTIEQVRREVAEEIVNSGRSPYALVLTEPEEKRYTEAGTVRIYGMTEPNCRLNINGQLFSADSGGAFSIQFPLRSGTNSFTINFNNGSARKTIIRKIDKP